MILSQFDDLDISLLTSENSGHAFELVCEVFVEGSVLHKAVGVSLDEYREYLSGSFQIMLQQGLSLVATDRLNGEVVGCLVACDYTTPVQALTEMPECVKPVSALLQRLDTLYRQQRQITPGDTLLVDMAVVGKGVRGRGLYRKLREVVHHHGYSAGFRRVAGELSSAATQHVCVTEFGHKVCVEIDYEAFEFSGHRPFSVIRDPRSIQLVEGELKAENL